MCGERVHRANAFGMRNSKSSFATKSCACAYIEFLAGSISWSVDSGSIRFHARAKGGAYDRGSESSGSNKGPKWLGLLNTPWLLKKELLVTQVM